jgi:hypothetical protein
MSKGDGFVMTLFSHINRPLEKENFKNCEHWYYIMFFPNILSTIFHIIFLPQSVASYSG